MIMMMNAMHKPKPSPKAPLDLRAFLAAGIEGVIFAKRFVSAKDSRETGDESTMETAKGLARDPARLSERALSGADKVMAFMANEDRLSDHRTSEFKRSLIEAFADARHSGVRADKAGLIVWAVKLYMDATKAAATPTPVAPSREVECHATRIVALFAKAAASKIVFPKIRLVAEGVGPVRFSVAGSRSKNPGSIMITDGRPFGENVYYGRITPEGKMIPSRDCNNTVRDLIVALANDPVGVARAHGHLHSNCCFCGRDLETRESVAVGYGPICADKFGLPWGEEKASGVVVEDAPVDRAA